MVIINGVEHHPQSLIDFALSSKEGFEKTMNWYKQKQVEYKIATEIKKCTVNAN